MKQFVLDCINKRIDAQGQLASEARRLGYETEERLYAMVERELHDLKREIDAGMPSHVNGF